jgi:hypothetical protein
MRRFATVFLVGFAVAAVHAQAPNQQGQQGQQGRQGQQGQLSQGRHDAAAGHAKMHHMGVDREAAICHALGMAIEGSALWHFAHQAESNGAKSDQKPGNAQAMRDPIAVLEQHARDAFRNSERLFQAVKQDERANQGNRNPQGNQAAGNNAQGSDHMARHEACEEFYRAARDYSRALETSCSETRQAGAQSSASIGSDVCAENTAKVALINCAVKGAVQGVALQQLLRHHGEHDRTTQALESHAQQMLSSSRHAIDSVDKEGAKAGQAQNAAGRQNKDQARDEKAQAGKKPSTITNVNNPADTKNNALAQNNRQAQADQGTLRRDAARPTYNDERAHSNLKPGEAITVAQLAKLGREVIRSVERLNQDQGQDRSHGQNQNQYQNQNQDQGQNRIQNQNQNQNPNQNRIQNRRRNRDQ